MQEKPAGNDQSGRRFMFIQNGRRDVVCPCPEAVNMYIAIILKYLLETRLASQNNYMEGSGSATIK